jgi:hyperosmotically inducible protein
MKARLLLAVFAVPVLLMLPRAADAQGSRDTAIAAEIGAAVRSYSRFTIFDHVSGNVEAGVVTLTGKVTMPFKKDEIAQRVSRVDGVREVRNEVAVLPASIYDDDLRRRIARAIYGDPAFWNYAAMANPPIHIIVENGRVTLTGIVNNNVERAIARSLASGRGELSLVNELRTDVP